MTKDMGSIILQRSLRDTLLLFLRTLPTPQITASPTPRNIPLLLLHIDILSAMLYSERSAPSHSITAVNTPASSTCTLDWPISPSSVSSRSSTTDAAEDDNFRLQAALTLARLAEHLAPESVSSNLYFQSAIGVSATSQSFMDALLIVHARLIRRLLSSFHIYLATVSSHSRDPPL